MAIYGNGGLNSEYASNPCVRFGATGTAGVNLRGRSRPPRWHTPSAVAAGWWRPAGGEDIHRRGLDVNAFSSQIGFVFQQLNLFPHLSVIDECTLAPKALKGEAPAAAQKRALALLERVGLAHKAHAYPSVLSGGQR